MTIDKQASGGRDWVWLLLLTVFAAAIRLFNLGGYGYFGDEYSTLGACVQQRVTEPQWPILFWLTIGFTNAVGLSEFTLRLIPALLGVLSIPAFYFAGRRLFGSRAMLFSGLFIALNHWHIFHSQSARFYTGVFLFTGLAFLLTLDALESGSKVRAVLAGLCTCLAAGFHPTALWLVLTVAISWVCLVVARRWFQASNITPVAIGFLATTTIACLLAASLLVHTAQYLDRSGGFWWGYTRVHVIMGWVRGIGLTVGAIGVFYLFERLIRRDREDRDLLMFGAALGPIFGLTVIAPSVAVRQDYAFSLAFVWYFAAGVAASRLAASTSIPRYLRVGFLAAIIGTTLPESVSQITQNLTVDPREAAEFIKQHASENDLVAHGAVSGIRHYSGLDVAPLPTSIEDLEERMTSARGLGGDYWFVVWRNRFGIKASKEWQSWFHENTRVVFERHARRFDYEVSSLLILRTPNAE